MKLLNSLKERARDLKRDTLALWIAYRDPRTRWYARVFSAVVVAYALSPIDLIPDFVPILGYLDDLILIPAGIALALKMIPAEVMADARVKAEEEFKGSRPANWIFAVLIILIWLAVIFFVGRWAWSLIQESKGS